MRPFANAMLRLLLALYPTSFRDRFGDDLASALEDRLDAIGRRGLLWRPFLIARLVADVAVAGARERVRPSFHAGSPSDASTHRHRRGSLVSALVQDLRFALRSLRRRPGFTVVALFTLALGIGASTAVFTVVDGVLLKPLPFPEPEELVIAWAYDTDDGGATASGDVFRGWMSQPDIESLRELSMVEAVEGLMTSSVTLTGFNRPERIDVSRSTGGVLSLLNVMPLMGRDLQHADNSPEAARVVVVSYNFWMNRLGSDPDAVGTTIQLNERSWEVVGVAPAGFAYPEEVELWQPYRQSGEGCGRGCHIYAGAVARLADGTTFEVAQEALGSLAVSLADAFPDTNTDKGLHFDRLIDYEVGDVRVGLLVVLGAVGLVLLIVCANTANLLLVRAAGRGREVAVRTALGASRGRLFTQVITESVVLAVIGAAIGLLLSFAMLAALERVAVEQLPRLAEVGVDGTVFLFLIGVTGAVALLFGLSPALNVSRRGRADYLLGGARGGAATGNRVRSVFLAAEVAFSILLLAGAGLLLRSMDQLYRVDMGWDGEHVTRFTTSLPSARYPGLEEIIPFYEQLEQELGTIPGVVSVGSIYGAPLMGGNISGTVLVEGRPEPAPGEETGASMRGVTPGYFETMGIPVLRGRGIEPTDRTDTEPIALVNEEFIRQNFPDEEVIGARVRITASLGYGSPVWNIVGVVRDTRRSMTGDPVPEVYAPQTQYGPGFMTVHMRMRPNMGSPIPAVREIMAAMDPNLVVRSVETMQEAKWRHTASMRFFLLLVTSFAGVAVVLAGVGLYGVVAYLVSQRTREIGIRMALGAKRKTVTQMVIRQGLRPTVVGVLAGVVAARYGGRAMEAMLFGVQPTDPLVLGGVSVLVMLVAMVATWIPARRATRVDPTEALRIE